MKPNRIDAVAVIVLNLDRRDLLLECLASVKAQRHAAVEIVVVDNGSSDGSADAVARQFPGVHVLRQSRNLGVAGGRNAGFAWVCANLRPSYLLFIDNDTLLDPQAVSAFVAAAAEDLGVGLVAPKAFRRCGESTLVSAGGMKFNPYVGAAWDVASGESDRGQFEAPHDVDACPGYAFFVRREVFEAIGGFDENFNPYGWEDVDFSLRARRAGFRLAYAPGAVVFHAGGRAGRGPNLRYERYKVQKMIYLVRRHSTPAQWFCFLLLFPIRGVYRVMREILTGNVGVVLAWLRGMLDRNPQNGRVGRRQ
ncbi:MAG TPA: glycosyltransferase family 2 protein [Alphaproteobacteria bacterium]|nr:glycosyltransferase family 2 protein [Alphaproteobacteria bacterium]